MAKFIMLDHSLYGVDGHHYSYAVNVLSAAELLGHEIVLATHVKFQPPADLPKSWRLLRVFTCDAHKLMTIGEALGGVSEQTRLVADQLRPRLELHRERAWHWIRTTFDWRNILPTHRRRVGWQRRWRRALEAYPRECQQVFQAIGINDGDTVFIPTLTVFDLERLVTFLGAQPDSRRAAWHLQFHFNILEGREPDYARQEASLAALRAHFAAQLGQVPNHRIFFYTTTRRLSGQYDRLRAGQFEPLPYPVDEAFQLGRYEPFTHRAGGRLRVTCAGCLRPEKGCEELESIVEGLWNGYFATDRLQLLIQVDQHVVRDFTVSLPGGRTSPLVATLAQAEAADDPVVCVRAPLSPEDYARLIQSAGIGLFVYQSERYYTRASGVLIEMLSAGIPVIVPAGCWLSAQIAEPIYAHVDRLAAGLPLRARYSAAQLPWRRNFDPSGETGSDAARRRGAARAPALEFGGSEHGITCKLPIPASATELALTITWPDSPPPGVYVRLISRQFDSAGNTVQTFSTVLEQRTGNLPTPALIHLKPGTAGIELTLENAFHSSTVELADVECRLLSAVDERCPAGAVGLIAADHAQLPELLADLTQNFDHYRATAVAFGKQ